MKKNGIPISILLVLPGVLLTVMLAGCQIRLKTDSDVSEIQSRLESEADNSTYPAVYSPLAYQLNRTGTAYTVIGMGDCTDSEVIIAEKLFGIPVTAIGEKAFADCTFITEIQIPNTVVTIGARAFCGCAGLKEIHIPQSVTDIGAQIFLRATSLKTVYYDSPYASDGNPFLHGVEKIVFGGNLPAVPPVCRNITTIKEVVLSPTVTHVNYRTFNGCSGIACITVPSTHIEDHGQLYYIFGDCWPENVKNVIITGVDDITDDAFNGCTDLLSVTLPEGLTKIGNRAFYGCEKLESISVPASVTAIGSDAFYNCLSLSGVYIDDIEAWCRICFGGNYYFSNPLRYAHKLYLDGSLLTELTLADGDAVISDYAFSGCTSLQYVTLPESLSDIGLAFFECTGLVGIHLTAGVTTIPQYAFFKCENLKSVVIPDSISRISFGAFAGCIHLESAEIPDSIVRISESAFEGCLALSRITYTGTKAQWNAIPKETDWSYYMPSYTVYCTDGRIE